MKAKEILIALSLKHDGNWDKIYENVLNKNCVDDYLLEKASQVKNAITILDEEYPEKLKRIAKPPFVLFYKGNIKLLNADRKSFFITGERNTNKHENIAEIAQKLAKKDSVLISGMANGVQKIAVDSFNLYNSTIGVLGCGIDSVYPKTNANEYFNVGNNGLLISEYPGDLSPAVEQFPARDRIIAGLCDCVIQSENETISPAVSLALCGGKDIYVIPKPFDLHSNGTNKLIIDGATPLVSLEQLD